MEWDEQEGILEFIPLNSLEVSHDDKSKLIDQNGEYLLDEEFDSITPDYFDNFTQIVQGENEGIWDEHTEKFIIEPVYDNVINFSDSSFTVQVDGKRGLINLQGNQVTEIKYDNIYHFQEGLAMVEKDGQFGFIDEYGNQVIDTQFSQAEKFLGGKAPVKQDGDFGIIEQNGDWLLEPELSSSEYSDLSNLSEELLTVEKEDEKGNRLFGIVNIHGEKIVKPQFDYIGDLKNDRLVVGEDDKFGYIKPQGEMIIEPQYQLASSFDEEGLATVEKNGKHGIIDKQGDYEIEPKYQRISDSPEQDKYIVTLDDEQGVIDQDGETVLEIDYDRIHRHHSHESEDSSEYLLVSDDDNMGLYTMSGEMILDLKYQDIGLTSQGVVSVEREDKWGFFDLDKEKMIAEPQFDQVSPFHYDRARVEVNDQWGYIDLDGDQVIEPQFDSAQDFQGGVARIIKEHQMGYIDTDGYYVYQPPEPPEPEETIQIGSTNWLETQLMSYIFKEALEQQGYEAEVILADVTPIFHEISLDDHQRIDFSFSAYLPNTHEYYYEEFGEDLDRVAEVLPDIKYGIAVPEYMDIESIEDLADKTEDLEGYIYGISSVAGISQQLEEVIREYDLDMDLKNLGYYNREYENDYQDMGDEEFMLERLDDHYQAENPVAVTAWTPHHKWAKWDLQMLDDPKDVFQRDDSVYTIGRESLETDLPDIYQALENFKLDQDLINSLLKEIDEQDLEIEEKAEEFVEENEQLVEEWFE